MKIANAAAEAYVKGRASTTSVAAGHRIHSGYGAFSGLGGMVER